MTNKPRPTVRREPDRAASTSASASASASELISARIEALGDWRGALLARVRALIKQADPDVVEEWKWRGTPVWSHDGLICTGETYHKVVKLTFAHGASLADPSGLFNASLEGNTRRAIDLHEGDALDEPALKALIRAAVARNTATRAGREQRRPAGIRRAPAMDAGTPRLLAGGNPRIAKADGDAPVQAYIAAMPGWKRELGRRLDALIVRNVPGVRKAVKWNSPFYGVEGQGWFLSFHVFTHYVKLTFFRGTSLRPVPAGGTGKDARWIDLREDDLDEARLAAWIRQAASLPGWGKS